jgi:hypothetical protein
MSPSQLPFPIPTKLSSGFRRILAYWQNLRRGENSVPFSDDVQLSSLPELADRLMLLDVFDNPQRFRFSLVGKQIESRYGPELAGKFLDHIDAKVPFEFLSAQASATVEARTPTFFSNRTATGGGRHVGYGRLLLPLWGGGRVGMILGAVDDWPDVGQASG